MKPAHREAFYASLAVSFCAFSLARAQVGRRIAHDAFPSVVVLVTEDASGQPRTLGSGFFVRSEVIATNLHVIQGASKGYVKFVGQQAKYEVAGIVGIDRVRDLALLEVTGAKAPSLALGDASEVAAGDEVYVVGNPRGLEGTISQGIVSGVRQVRAGILIQITAPISPGSSGGPVLNTKGVVIGIATATVEHGQNLNFAVPASYLVALLSNTNPVRPLFLETNPGQYKPSPLKRPSPGCTPGPSVSNEVHLLACRRLSAKSSYKEAERECRKALKIDPTNVEAHYYLGIGLSERGETYEAIAEFREAVRLDPENAQTHAGLGIALHRSGELDESIFEYRRALNLKSQDVATRMLLGLVLVWEKAEDDRKKGNWDAALTEYREALELLAPLQEKSELAQAHYGIGVALEHKGDEAGAVDEYREALRLNPNHARAHGGLSSVLSKKGDIDGAIVEMREAARLEPNQASAHRILGFLFRVKGDRQAALDEFRKAYLLSPNDPEIRADYEGVLRESNH